MNVVSKQTRVITSAIPVNPLRLLFGGAILLFLLWLGLKGWAIGRAISSLQSWQTETESFIDGGITELDPEKVEALVLGIRKDVVVLKKETAVFIPIMPHLVWVPRWGTTLAVMPTLMEMADAGTETAVYAIRGFKPAIPLLSNGQSGTEVLPEFLAIIDSAQPEIAAMDQSFARFTAARVNLGDGSHLPWRLRTLLEQADVWLPLAEDGLQILPHIPQIMGLHEPQSYLILAQNADELRPTGGFISGAGLLEVENGRITNLEFLDANLVDNWQEKPYDFPPQPLYDHMGLELFLFRDANFWPDFPTSAEKAMALYGYGQDVQLPDGTIAVDQQFLKLLVEATGPVTTPDSEFTITNENAISMLRAAWGLQDGEKVSEWALDRKAFIGEFAQAVQAKIESDFGSVDPLLLLQNTIQALETKHLQIYLRDAAIAAQLNELHWDGRLPTNVNHDFLMVVDTNMGYTKVNSLIRQSINYTVQINEDNSALANLEIQYQHAGNPDNTTCQQGIYYNSDTVSSYDNLVNNCYWNFLRLYTPPNSQLVDSSQHFVPEETMVAGKTWDSSAQQTNDLAGLNIFKNYLMVRQGELETSHFTYNLPETIIQNVDGLKQYRLEIFKQAGKTNVPTTIQITLPSGVEPVSIFPDPEEISDDKSTIDFAFDLEQDTVIVINFQ